MRVLHELSVAGLTGATVVGRWVGMTASGAPTTGTFAANDWVIDQAGVIWLCTAGGTPGTWTKVTLKNLAELLDVSISGIADGQLLSYRASDGKIIPATPAGNGEIAYAESVGNNNTAASSTGGSGTAVDIGNLSISVPATTRPVYLELYLGQVTQVTNAGAGRLSMQINETTSGVVLVSQGDAPLPASAGVAGSRVPVHPVKYRLGPVASTRTFKATIQVVTATGVSANVSVTNSPTSPSYLKAWSE